MNSLWLWHYSGSDWWVDCCIVRIGFYLLWRCLFLLVCGWVPLYGLGPLVWPCSASIVVHLTSCIVGRYWMVDSLVVRRSYLEGGFAFGESFESTSYFEGFGRCWVGFDFVLLFCIVPKWFVLRERWPESSVEFQDRWLVRDPWVRLLLWIVVVLLWSVGSFRGIPGCSSLSWLASWIWPHRHRFRASSYGGFVVWFWLSGVLGCLGIVMRIRLRIHSKGLRYSERE